MIDIADKIQEDVFRYDIVSLKNNIHQLIEGIAAIMPSLNIDLTTHLNEILKLISIAMQNEDYILVADIILYELKPFIAELKKA